jgi:hypothetical protein
MILGIPQVNASKDEDERMPSKGEALSTAQIDLLKRLIDGGAEWPDVVASTGVVAPSEMIVPEWIGPNILGKRLWRGARLLSRE